MQNEDNLTEKQKDSYNLVYVLFFLMGIGSLLPWNFFITAKDYWIYKLSNSSSYSKEGEPTLCLSFSRLSPKLRVLSSLWVIFLVFVVTTVLVKVDVSNCQTEFFVGTLVSVAVVSGASNIFSGSMFGLSAYKLRFRVTALALGQAMGGTLSSLASIVNLAAVQDVTTSALFYFLTADVFILLCIFSYLLLKFLCLFSCNHFIKIISCFRFLKNGGGAANVVPPLQPIIKKAWVLGLSVFYVFFISISVFPAVSSGIQSVNVDSGSPWTTTYFVPITSFFLYNFADFCGRQATMWVQVPGPTSRFLPALVLCRSVMVPLLMFCNFQPRDHLHTVLFARDVYPVVFNCLLGLSNGYLGTLPMIYGPKVVPRELAEATGVVMSFFLTLGLAVGSKVHLVFRGVITASM
uniref:Solute carrier family 29 member 3 n=1 Tax=Oryzias melastigma TaxID=30732 RepID=A0A3B3CTB3_ORYME